MERSEDEHSELEFNLALDRQASGLVLLFEKTYILVLN